MSNYLIRMEEEGHIKFCNKARSINKSKNVPNRIIIKILKVNTKKWKNLVETVMYTDKFSMLR